MTKPVSMGGISDRLRDWIARTGWPTRVDDEALADWLYGRWLRETHDQWVTSGLRDREPLGDALEAELARRHGEDDASHIFLLLLLFLECRSRREGQNRARPDLQ